MKKLSKTETRLLRNNAELRARLQEAEEALRAIRAGEGDGQATGGTANPLQDAEASYRILLEAMHEGAAALAEDGTILYCNSRLAGMLCTPPQDLVGASLRRFIAPAGLQAFDTMLAESSQNPCTGEVALQGTNAPAVAVEIFLSRLRVHGSYAVGLVATDLIDRKRAEDAPRRASGMPGQSKIERTAELARTDEAWRETEKRFDLGANAAREAIWDCDLVTGTVRWNEACDRLCGTRPRESANFWQWWIDRIHPDDRDRILNTLSAARDGADMEWTAEYRFRCADGGWAVVLDRAQIVRDENGRAVRILGSMLDLTECRRFEQKLAEQAYMLANVSDAIIGLDMDYRVSFWSPSAARMYGYTEDETLGRLGFDVLRPTCITMTREEAHRRLEDCGYLEVEFIEYTKDGRALHIDSRTQVLHDKRGEPIGMVAVNRDITERKRVDEALLQGEQRFRTLFETMTEGFAQHEILTDEQGRPNDYRFLDVNPAFERLTGMKRADLIGKRVLEVLPGIEPHWIEHYGRVALTGEPLHMENYSSELNRWYEVFAYCTAPRRFAVVFTDITPRKQVEEDLRQSRQRLAWVLENTGVGTWLNELPLGRLNWDEQTKRLFFLEPDMEPSIELFWSRLHPEDREPTRLAVESAIRDRTLYAIDHRAVDPGTGEIRWIRSIGQATCAANGTSTHFDGINYDITERKVAEEALRHSEERFRALAEALPEIVWAADAKGAVEWFNHRWYDYIGKSQETGEWWSWDKCVHPEDLAQTLKKWREAQQEGELFQNEIRVRRHDGQYHWFLVRAWPLRDANGNIVRWFGTNTDVQDMKEAEAALRQSRNDLDRAQEVGQVGSWRLDVRRNILTWSDENYRIFGVPREAPLTYETFLDSVHPDDRKYVDTQWRAGLRGEPYDIEHRILVDGQVKWVREKAYLEFDEGGKLLGGFGISQDITERMRAEEALRRANEELEARVRERTAELSRTVDTLEKEIALRTSAEEALRNRGEQLRALASELTLAEQRERRRLAEVLHDNLQQLLVGAKFRLAMLGRAADSSVKLAADEAEDLLDQSIECSRSLTGELSPPILHQGGLVPALEWLAVWMQQKHGFTVLLQADESASPKSEDTKVLLFQSVRELLFNALKHAGVRTAFVRLAASDDHIEVTVSDDGAGFDRESVAPRAGRAMGFGLFSIHERLELLGGRLEIDSAPGRGSRFRLLAPQSFTLPEKGEARITLAGVRISKIAAAPHAGDGLALPIPRRIRVLLVDDHVVVRQGLSRLLKEEPDIEIVGEASDGETAVTMVRQILPDVVTMDINMPGMGGIEATRAIHAEFPQVRVIGLSLFDEGELARAIREAGAVDYLTKSGPSEALVAAIRACASAGD